MLLGVFITVWLLPRKSDSLLYEVGRPWKYRTLYAPFDIPVYPDSLTISQGIDSINANFIYFYKIDNSATSRMTGKINKMWNNKESERLRRSATEIISNGLVSEEVYTDALAGRFDRYRRVVDKRDKTLPAKNLLSPRAAYRKLQEEARSLNLLVTIDMTQIGNIFEPNLVPDTLVNNERLNAAYDKVRVPNDLIVSGQTVINQGEKVTPQLYSILQTYEEMLSKRGGPDGNPIYIWLGKVFFVGIFFMLLGMYLSMFRRKIFEQSKAVAFVSGLVVVFAVVSFLMARYYTAGIYLVPLTIIPIMLTVFFDASLALFVSVITTLICGMVAVAPMEYIAMQVAGSVIAVTSLKELSRRSQLVRTAAYIFLGYVTVYVSLNLMITGNWSSMSLWMIGILAINMIFISFAYVLIFVIERWLGFTSLVGLVELSDINHPLLRELSRVCPGTFQHSMAVSNLAGEAAEKLGANVQLIRAGALYHDIGKIDNPAFFTENQHGVNPHDALDPLQSARIITGHVTAGLKRADKANLPKVIRDFIAQHHGKGVARYFYITYCNQHPDEEVDRTPFTYVGPNPQTLESSILMMADAVEAASRSLKEYDRDSITGLVTKIIDSQIAEGLHAESPLSFRDVQAIKDSFIQRLLTIYHSRIAYPSAKK